MNELRRIALLRAAENIPPRSIVSAQERFNLAKSIVETYFQERNDHPDDVAVDHFAAAMKEKLAKKRAEGRQGWDDKADCSNVFLSQLLWEHMNKGDPVDIGNLAMMIFCRDEKVASLLEALQGE